MQLAVKAAAEEHNPILPALPDLIWGTLCFVVILVFFWKLALPRMQKLLDERAEAIEGNIAKADQAQHQAEALLAEYTKQLADARAEAGTIRATAHEDAKSIVSEARENAVTEAARVAANAQAQIEAERNSALVSLRSQVGTIAVDLASGVVGESLADDRKAHAVVDRFLADLESKNAVKSAKATSRAKAGK